MTNAIKKHYELQARIFKIDDSASQLKVHENCLAVLTRTNDEVLEPGLQYIDSLPANDKAFQSSSKTSKKTVTNGSGDSTTSKPSSQKQKNEFEW